jgi:predicted transcriptional regulator
MEHTAMLRKNWGNFDIHDLSKIVETLIAAEIITTDHMGNKVYYTLTDKATGIYLSGKEN